MRGQLGRYVVKSGVPSPTPDWDTVVWDISDDSGTVSGQQITGTNIGITIRLEIEWPVVPEDDGDSVYDAQVWIAVVDGVEDVVPTEFYGSGDEWQQVANNDEVFVPDGWYVSFASKNPPAGTADNKVRDAVVTVRNLYDNAILDTFGAQVRN